jgi:carbamoyltransferase
VGRGSQIEILESIPLSSNWEQMYEKVTARLGFRARSGEEQVMAISVEGEGDVFPFVDWNEPFPRIRPRAFRDFVAGLPQRRRGEPLTDEHRTIAASLKTTLECAVLLLSRYLERRTGLRDLCFAGGTALNASVSGVLFRGPYVDRIFVQPASSDAGAALGAAIWVHAQVTGRRPEGSTDYACWGPSNSQGAVGTALFSRGLEPLALEDYLVGK